MIRFGVHCSIRGGLSHAIEEAHRIGCESVQIFTRSPRMWHIKSHPAGEIKQFKELRKKLQIYPLVVHIPYLPNLATSNKILYDRSLKALIDDLSIGENIGADYLVIHPGAYSEGSTRKEGIRNIVNALNHAFNDSSEKIVVLLENVAGGGRRIGAKFEELSEIMDGVKNKERVGICFDTAHAFGAGYDVSDKNGIESVLAEFDKYIGLDQMKVIHFNDSLVELGAEKDRHYHIGKGHIGLKGFEYFISQIKNSVIAGILETPKDHELADKRNLAILYKCRDKGRMK